MSDVRSSGRQGSLGGLLGAGAGTAWRRLKGKAGRQSSVGAALGSRAGSGWRVLKGEPGRNQRIMRGVRSGTAAFLTTVLGTLKVLFLEVSGFIFLCFTAIIVGAFVREYRKYAMHQVGVERVILAGALSTMFLYFGMSSFWRARRKRSRT
jgi:hypothetical protein